MYFYPYATVNRPRQTLKLRWWLREEPNRRLGPILEYANSLRNNNQWFINLISLDFFKNKVVNILLDFNRLWFVVLRGRLFPINSGKDPIINYLVNRSAPLCLGLLLLPLTQHPIIIFGLEGYVCSITVNLPTIRRSSVIGQEHWLSIWQMINENWSSICFI